MFRTFVLALVFPLVAFAFRDAAHAFDEGELQMDMETENLSTEVASVVTGNYSLTEEKQEVREGEGSNVSLEMLEAAIEARHAKYKGTVLLDRYVLQELRIVELTPGRQFPASIKGYSNVRHLGKGGFGDTWKAWDRHRGRHGAYVAVKIFHSDGAYISASTRNPNFIKKLDINSHECKTIKSIADAAPRQGEIGKYVKYLCLCLEDHIWDGQKTGQPAFLVYELCGETIMSMIEPQPGVRSLQVDIMKARTIVNHIIRGLRYLNSFNPAWIHHDLKPENVCWMEETETTKIIDWGAMIQATAESAKKPAVATLPYKDPGTQAVFGIKGRAWVGYSWSYDLYATGLIYAELLCPQVTVRDWMVEVARGQFEMKNWSPLLVIKTKCNLLTGIDEDIQLLTEMANHDYLKRPTLDDADRRLGVLRT